MIQEYPYLADYKTYRRECRAEGITRPMDYETFAAECEREIGIEVSEWFNNINSMSSPRRYI